ncbi:MAG TPA: ATP-grasp domain-containing protein [Steroidobacter sp.]|uniref:ATP-grasp domain-containing protein n=1 Tax=Steroidobacter sp. TaxID=1978227 RepID=UPI002EDA8530
MRILYPDDPLDQRRPEPLFQAEYELARARGFELSIFSFEDFERGRFDPRPRPAAGEEVLYRGWMLNVDGYARLVQSIEQLSAGMVVSPESYRAAHHLPSWYPLVREFTAETLMCEPDADFEALLAGRQWPGYFVKDYVKSSNTGAGSLVATPGEVPQVVAALKKYRGEIEGGVCVRRKEEYLSGSERRYFVANGAAFSSDGALPAVVTACATRIPSPFFSVDVAQRNDGELRIVEIGDGQVSDRKEWSADQLVDILARTWLA